MHFLKTASLRILILFTLISCTATGNTVIQNVSQFQVVDTTSISKDTISITAVGDIMIGSAYPTMANLPKHDGLKSFKAVDSFLKGDIVFGNLEGCFLNDGKSTKCKDTTGNSCFAFRMPERYAGIIKKAGFNLLSIANNHVGDFGLKGSEKTMKLLDSLEIKYAGLLSHPSVFFEKDSIRYAFCAFAPNENTVSINQLDSAKALVSALKARAHIVIVSFHGGGEGSNFQHVPRAKEVFYKENRGDVYEFAHLMIDAGADVILGHGPHVTRAMEVYKSKFIAYSLGNFCTYGMFNLSGPSGIAPILQLKINSKGDFLFADIVSVKQTKINGLKIDSTHAAFKKIRFLTNTDLPGHQLRFSANGRIELKK